MEHDHGARTWMLLTAGTLGASVLCVLIESVVGGRTAAILMAVVAPLLVAGNLAALADLLLREWFHVSLPHLLWRQRHHGRHDALPPLVYVHRQPVPWRLARVLDHYLALNVAWALLLLVYWVWAPAAHRDLYIELPGKAAQHNVWAAWLVTLVAAFSEFNTAGFGHVVIQHPASAAVELAMVITDRLVDLIILGVVVAEAVEAIRAAAKHSRARRPEPDAGGTELVRLNA